MPYVRRVAAPVLVIIVVVALAGCSGNGARKGLQPNDSRGNGTTVPSDTGPTDSNPPAPEPPVTQSSADLPSESELHGALLTTDDLPSGFAQDSSSDSTDEDAEFAADDPACERAIEALQSDDSDDTDVEADFVRNEAQYVHQDLSTRPNEAEHFRAATQAVRDDCGGSITVSGDSITSGTLKVIGNPNIGDDSLAFHFSFNGDANGTHFTGEGYIVVSRRKNVTSSVQAFAISAPDAGLDPTPPNYQDALSVARNADSRVEELVGG